MAYYLINRLVQFVAVLAFLSIIVFTIIRLIPGDPAAVMLGTEATPEVLAQIRHEMGLDQPIPVQYLKWLQNVAAGNFGTSWVSKKPALQLILGALPVTLQLVGCSFFIALFISFPAGLFSALRPRSWVDQGSTTFALLGISLPSFWLGIMLILLFSVTLGWLPASGFVSPFEDLGQSIAATVMPAFVLGNAIAAVLMRHMRSAMLNAVGSDYVRTARAKGLPERTVILKHALRNALTPVITLGALEFGTLLSGAVLTEQVFSIPGFGKLIVDAVFNRDYAVVQGVVLVTASVYILLNLLADVLYVLVNPRLRD